MQANGPKTWIYYYGEIGVYLEQSIRMIPAHQMFCDIVILFSTEDIQDAVFGRGKWFVASSSYMTSGTLAYLLFLFPFLPAGPP